jgi:hypothetical protein
VKFRVTPTTRHGPGGSFRGSSEARGGTSDEASAEITTGRTHPGTRGPGASTRALGTAGGWCTRARSCGPPSGSPSCGTPAFALTTGRGDGTKAGFLTRSRARAEAGCGSGAGGRRGKLRFGRNGTGSGRQCERRPAGARRGP